MGSKQYKRPPEGIVEPEEAARRLVDPDVEGHGLPTTAPPSLGAPRSPGHGGENIPSPVDDDDVEGHKRR